MARPTTSGDVCGDVDTCGVIELRSDEADHEDHENDENNAADSTDT